jgi:hypothetical protein
MHSKGIEECQEKSPGYLDTGTKGFYIKKKREFI